MTKIRLGDFVLEGSSYEWTVHRVKVKESGENEGEEYLAAIGHFGRLPQALERLLDQKLREGDATTLEDLAKNLAEFRQELAPLLTLGEG